MVAFISAGSSDFVGNSGHQLVFSQTTRSMMIQIRIIDDNLLEDVIESFNVSLTSDVPRLELLPNKAVVRIIDDENDCKCMF